MTDLVKQADQVSLWEVSTGLSCLMYKKLSHTNHKSYDLPLTLKLLMAKSPVTTNDKKNCLALPAAYTH